MAEFLAQHILFVYQNLIMKFHTLFFLFTSLLFISCANSNQKNIPASPHYLFYLHGRIVEDQGPEAYSERYGAYEYQKIIERFEKEKFIVKSEARPSGTDNSLYAQKITAEINDLIKNKIPPQNITIVGASKGAAITMLISTELKNRDLNFVIMGNCNDWIMENYDINLFGNILSIYESSDEVGGNSCENIFSQSNGIQKKKEIKLNTGLGHGFLYRPIDEWVLPSIDWTNNHPK